MNDSFDSRLTTPECRGSKHVPCGVSMIAFFGIFLLPMVILSTLITTIIIVTNNELCKYLRKPSAWRITDAAIDLFVEYEWFRFIPLEVQKLMQLRAPKQILNGLLYKCQPKSETDFIPLIPALGLDNLVNVTAILDHILSADLLEKAGQ
ncbi:unnamed protein product [Dicrocoelium dendriticum]|nr:unnamed protein product [Dicrocoelium dendriticum]